MAAKKPRQTKDPVTHRFQSTLTRALCDQLCKTHEEGRDFRNVTAVMCDVHPVTLTRWLKLGAESPDAGLHTELYMRMCKTEGGIRADWIAEVADTTVSLEDVTYDDGKPVGKTTTSRRTHGIQWLLEKRFRQFRKEHIHKVDELEVTALLEPQAVVYTADMVLGIVQQMAQDPERLPPAIRQLFANTDWRVPKELTDGQAKH
jgi:hypothetical protein